MRVIAACDICYLMPEQSKGRNSEARLIVNRLSLVAASVFALGGIASAAGNSPHTATAARNSM